MDLNGGFSPCSPLAALGQQKGDADDVLRGDQHGPSGAAARSSPHVALVGTRVDLDEILLSTWRGETNMCDISGIYLGDMCDTYQNYQFPPA